MTSKIAIAKTCEVQGCKRVPPWGTLCNPHYRRKRKGAPMEPEIARRRGHLTILERLMDCIEFDTNGGCWLWAFGTYPDGYGVTKFDGRNQGAHRVAWQVFHGPIPDGLHVLHRCDVPACINPEHLWLGTNADNVADRVAKGREGSHAGEANGRARLKVADVIAILGRSDEAATVVCLEYGVCQQSILNIWNRVTWPHVIWPGKIAKGRRVQGFTGPTS